MADIETDRKNFKEALPSLGRDHIFVFNESPTTSRIRANAQQYTVEFLITYNPKDPKDSLQKYTDKIVQLYAEQTAVNISDKLPNSIIAGIEAAATVFIDTSSTTMAVRTLLGSDFPIRDFVKALAEAPREGIKGFEDLYFRRYGVSIRDDLKNNLSPNNWRFIELHLDKDESKKTELNALKLYRAARSFIADPTDSVFSIMRSMSLQEKKEANDWITKNITPNTHRTLDDLMNSLMSRKRLEQARAALRGDAGLDLAMEVEQTSKDPVAREQLFATLAKASQGDLQSLQATYQRRNNRTVESQFTTQYGDLGAQRIKALLENDIGKQRVLGLRQLTIEKDTEFKGMEVLFRDLQPIDRSNMLFRFQEITGEQFAPFVRSIMKNKIELLEMDDFFNTGKRSKAAALQRLIEDKNTSEAKMMGALLNTSAGDFESALLLYINHYRNNLPQVIINKFPNSDVIKDRIFALNPLNTNFSESQARFNEARSEASSGLVANIVNGSIKEIRASDSLQESAISIKNGLERDYPRIGQELSLALLRIAEVGFKVAGDEKRSVARKTANGVAAVATVAALAYPPLASVSAPLRTAVIATGVLTLQTGIKFSLVGTDYMKQEFISDAIYEAVAAPSGVIGSTIMRNVLREPIQRMALQSLQAEIGEAGLIRLGRKGFREALSEKTVEIMGGLNRYTPIFGAGTGAMSGFLSSNTLQVKSVMEGGSYRPEEVLSTTGSSALFGAVGASVVPLASSGAKMAARIRAPRLPTESIQVKLPAVPPTPAVSPEPPTSESVPSGNGKPPPIPTEPGKKFGIREERMGTYTPEQRPSPLPSRPPQPPPKSSAGKSQSSAPRITEEQLRAPLTESELSGKMLAGGETKSVLTEDKVNRTTLGDSERGKARELYRTVNGANSPTELLSRYPSFHHVNNKYFQAQTGKVVDGELYSININRLHRLVFTYEGNGKWSNFWIGDYHE